jgi:hypothetical protein
MNPAIDLAVVVLAIRLLREQLEGELAIDPALQKRYLGGDPTVAGDATLSACHAVGLVVDDYRRIVDSHPSLLWLETETIRETFVGSTDPGPYDMISRESASAALPDQTD